MRGERLATASPPREAEAPGSPTLTSAREERLELGLLAQRVEV